jgi:two-component system, OmpR family, response regulator
MKVLVIDSDTAWLGEARATVEDGGHVIEQRAALPSVEYPVQAYIEAVLISWQNVDNAAWWVQRLRHSAPGVQVLALIEHCQRQSMREAFEAGVIDCLVKPVRPLEVLARLELLAWRQAHSGQTVFRLGDVHIDLEGRRASRAGLPVALTAAEWRLVTIVLSRRGRLVPRAVMESALSIDGADQASNRLEVHISNLRRKLGPRFIETERRMGYRVSI